MIVVDQKVRFDVFADVKDAVERMSLMVTGTVYDVNYAHRVFHVVYNAGNTEQLASFNFCDIGTKVQVL